MLEAAALRCNPGMCPACYSSTGSVVNRPVALRRSTQAHYRFYGSGRRYCESYTCELVLKRRQDLYMVLWGIFNPIRYADQSRALTLCNRFALGTVGL